MDYWLKGKDTGIMDEPPVKLMIRTGGDKTTNSYQFRLDIQPRDGVGASAYRHYHADYNIGAQNSVHTGGARISYLMLPVIPPKV